MTKKKVSRLESISRLEANTIIPVVTVGTTNFNKVITYEDLTSQLQEDISGSTGSTHITNADTLGNIPASGFTRTEEFVEGLLGKSNTGHTHTISNIDTLQTSLNSKSNTGHTHQIGDVNNLQETINSISASGITPQYTLILTREQAQWTDDWLKITHTSVVHSKEIVVYNLTIQLGSGVKTLGAIVSYPRAETYNTSVPNEFYVKDVDAILSKSTNFDHIKIEYSILDIPIGTPPNYDTRNILGENVIQDENSGESVHSRMMRDVFLGCYHELWAEYGIESFESIKDSRTGFSSLSGQYEPKFMELTKSNMLFRPYVNGALSEQVGSNPHILKVSSHYGNWGHFSNPEINITAADNIFLSNVVAIGARTDDMTTVDFVPDGQGLLGRYGWTSDGWTGDFGSGFTHTTGNTTPLTRNCFANSPRLYWIDFIVTNRTTGSFVIKLNEQNSNPFSASGRFVLTTTSLNDRVITITPTSDFDGKIEIRVNEVHYISSYGRGLEFFEDLDKGFIMSYPLPDDWVPYAHVCTNVDGTIIQSTIGEDGQPTHGNWTDSFNIGDMVELRTSPVQTVEVAEILGTGSIRIVTPIVPIANASSNPYIWRFKTDRILQDLTGHKQQQSPTCSIVGAKLKNIKLLTGVNWQIVREAARMTATNSTFNGTVWTTNWDKFRGFGMIRPDLAVQYIKDNYTENSNYIDSISADVQRAHGINKILKYENITGNSPVTKDMLEKIIAELLEQINA